MFKQAIIHSPADPAALACIVKELAAFRCVAAVKYIESLNLDDNQIKILYDSLAEEVATRQRKSA